MNEERVYCQKYISCNGSREKRERCRAYIQSGGTTDKEIDLGAEEFPELLRNLFSHLSERAAQSSTPGSSHQRPNTTIYN